MRNDRTATLVLCAAAVTFTGCSGAGTAPATQSLMNPAASSTAGDRSSASTVRYADDLGVDARVRRPLVGIRLTGESATSTPQYGDVLGYFLGKRSKSSEVVNLTTGDNVVFMNVDSSLPHTASFLGDATGSSAPWPSKFTGSSTASPKGTTLGTTGFSTGTLNPGQKSAVYNAGSPGFYMFGCFYHYVPDHMRTVIIVQ